MIRIHRDNFVPKYRTGVWAWNEITEKMEFHSVEDQSAFKEEYMSTGGYKFRTNMNQLEEMIFRQEFQRSDNTHDADVILIQDIKNLVLYLAPKELMCVKFIKFVHTNTVDHFLHALIVYFEHFLKLVEFVLIRRDEISGDKAQLQSEESTNIKRILSAQLTQHRLLLAREYSEIILGNGDMKSFYHTKPIVNITQTIWDKHFHELFLAFCTQVVYVCMHTQSYDLIEAEMSRLFRSEHFKLTRNERVKYTRAEAGMLFGVNYRRLNYRAQNSPLIQELNNVMTENLPILWIGKRKYRGNDFRIHQLELEHIVPPSQLCLIAMTHGILGHPKKIYNTMLRLEWGMVREQGYSELYDPYNIIRQPYLELPKLDAETMRKFAEQYDPYYEILHNMERVPTKILRNWLAREDIIEYFKTKGVIMDVWRLCDYEVHNENYGPSVDEIVRKFIARKEKLRKK